MKAIMLLLMTIISFSFAHTGAECPECGYDQIPMWQCAICGFLFFILGCFLFSLIFWAVYIWFVKGKEKKSL